jgi:hypothetical protein
MISAKVIEGGFKAALLDRSNNLHFILYHGKYLYYGLLNSISMYSKGQEYLTFIF